jgi:iron complex transport system ATP-binding protein
MIGVFHDLNLARQFGDSVLIMNDGTIAAQGTIEETMNGEILRKIYGVDIRAFMRESLGKWQ